MLRVIERVLATLIRWVISLTERMCRRMAFVLLQIFERIFWKMVRVTMLSLCICRDTYFPRNVHQSEPNPA
jgi:hypothetical protein